MAPLFAGMMIFGTLVIAAVILASSGLAKCDRPQIIVPAASWLLAVHAAHLAEEFGTGFHERMPDLVGIAPFPAAVFVCINLAWVACWALAIGAVSAGRMRVPATAALLVLAFASCLNFVAHPLLSLITGGYFPGTVTALILGPLGWNLIRRLMPASRPKGHAAG